MLFLLTDRDMCTWGMTHGASDFYLFSMQLFIACLEFKYCESQDNDTMRDEADKHIPF
jgi:hypothetical protein